MSEQSGAVRVKICGLTTPDNAAAVANGGADAIGINLWPGSKRHVPLEQTAWVSGLPPFLTRVAVLVNPEYAEALAAWKTGRFDFLQLHGGESAHFCAALASRGVRLIKAVPALPDLLSQDWAAYCAAAILVDTPSAGFGGSGRVFEWAGVAGWNTRFPMTPLILSGGLTPANVADAVRQVRPYGVDVAGGVESHPGMKDPARVEAFCQAAKNALSENRQDNWGT